MRAANRATPLKSGAEPESAAEVHPLGVAAPPSASPKPVPLLRVVPLQPCMEPRRFQRVPTHTVGVHPEQRIYPRASLKLPLRLRSVDGMREQYPVTLVTRDISSTGVFFLCPRQVAVGAKVELEVVLVSKPLGRGNVVMTTIARVNRTESAATPGWYGVAASFDDVQFGRDDVVPTRFR